VAAGGGYVWVTTFRGGPAGNRLVKIAPATGRVLAIQPMPGNYGKGGLAIAATSTAVWLLDDGGPAIRAVDPAGMHVVASARTGAAQYTRALAVSGRDAWALIDGTLDRIDPPWSAVSRQVPLYRWPSATSADGALGNETLAAGPAGTLWAAGPALTTSARRPCGPGGSPASAPWTTSPCSARPCGCRPMTASSTSWPCTGLASRATRAGRKRRAITEITMRYIGRTDRPYACTQHDRTQRTR
jgi:hypothetical protein